MVLDRIPSVEDAAALAAEAHVGQTDKAGRPYTDHTTWVAETARERGWSDAVQRVGHLHDTVEDTAVTLAELVERGYPDDEVDAVDSMTRRWGETYMDMIRRAAAHPLGTVGKLLDNEHNSLPERVEHLTWEHQAFVQKRYPRARRVLLAAYAEHRASGALSLYHPDPPVFPSPRDEAGEGGSPV